MNYNADDVAQRLHGEHPGKPLLAFWHALSDQRHCVAMAVVNDPRCGIERRSKVAISIFSRECYINSIKGGSTPLLFAAFAGRTDVIIDLLAAGADVTASDFDRNFTPLHLVRSVEAARLLIAHGCDVNARDSNGNTPLQSLVTSKSDFAAIELLIAEGADVRVLNNKSLSLLHVAIEHCKPPSLNVVRLLIEKGCDIDSGGERMKRSGVTPLHLATWNSCTDIVRLLVAEGASLNYGSSNVHSLTPLCSAVQKDSLGVIQDLLDAGSDVTFMSAKETTGGPLHYASTRTTIELLVAEGADVNDADAFDDTPLHWVPQRSSRDCGELLISKGARVNAVNRSAHCTKLLR